MAPPRSAASLALAALGALHAPAGAAQLDVPTATLCALSDAVVVARVSDLETLWSAGPEGGIERRAFVDVGRVARARAGLSVPRAVEVVLPGGEIDAVRHWVEDVPHLDISATYLLFLHRGPDAWEIVGGERGARRVAVGDLGAGWPLRELLAELGACRV